MAAGKITGKEKYNIAKYNLKYLELAYILFGLANILGIIMKYRDFKTFIGFLAILHSNCKNITLQQKTYIICSKKYPDWMR